MTTNIQDILDRTPSTVDGDPVFLFNVEYSGKLVIAIGDHHTVEISVDESGFDLVICLERNDESGSADVIFDRTFSTIY